MRQSGRFVREKIGDIAERLPAGRFLRIQRSYIVNVAALQALYPAGGGEHMAALRNGRELPVGPSYPAAIERALSDARIPRFGGSGGVWRRAPRGASLATTIRPPDGLRA